MYGMINQAVRELVVGNHGEPTWRKICAEAGLADTEFNSMRQYADSVTYDLVGAASKVLNTPPAALLEQFGEFWTDFARNTDFARLMKFGGNTLVEFVQNLDHMHAKIKSSLPQLVPPSFRCTDVTNAGFRLHYYSTRPGLVPLVIGMMKGMARLYEQRIEIEIDKTREQGHDHDVLVVRYV